MADYCTLAEVKTLLNVSLTGDDVLLSSLITRASAMIYRYTGRSFSSRTETRYYRPGQDTQDGTLWLDDDLISIASLSNADGKAIPNNGYYLRPLNFSPKSIIELKTGYSWGMADVITLTGVWGFYTEPNDIKQAACRLTAWLYQQRDAPFGRTGNRLTGEYEVPIAIPADVETTLKLYRRVVIR